MILHAGCLARRVGDRWRGVLVTGPSGAGKSDLALRLMAEGWALVADDRARVWACDGLLYARAPGPLAGLVEARGLGVLPASHRRLASIDLLVACVASDAAMERVPERGSRTLAGVTVEEVALHALEASAPAKLALALARTLDRPLDRPLGFPRPGSRF